MQRILYSGGAVGPKPRAGRLTWMQPLPLVPPGSVAVAEGVAFLEDDERTGTDFIWGQACFTWDGTDPGARRLAAVQLVKTGAGLPAPSGTCVLGERDDAVVL